MVYGCLKLKNANYFAKGEKMLLTSKQLVSTEEELINAPFKQACKAIRNRLTRYQRQGHVQNIKLDEQGNWMDASYEAIIPGFVIQVALHLLSHAEKVCKLTSQITVHRTVQSFEKR